MAGSKELESIRDTAMEGRYAAALAALDMILRTAPKNIQALRLRGNVLELRALDRAQYSAAKLLRSRDYVRARSCYEQILEQDPSNTLALIDLGDHFRNLGAADKAGTYYEAAIDQLSKGRFSWSRKDEIEEVFDQAIALYKEAGNAVDLQRLAKQRSVLLHRIRAHLRRRHRLTRTPPRVLRRR